MLVFGYLAALLIGISLGLIGGGGSVLTVPVLVYLFGVEPALATGYSLFVVGVTSLIGSYESIKRKQVHLKTVSLFGITSIITVVTVRRLLLPAVPPVLGTIGSWQFTRSTATMILFALLLLAASVSMIRIPVPRPELAGHSPSGRWLPLMVYGILIGFVTGLLGAGGGFLLIPALVFVVGLPMKQAVGTSLLIIALNALIGFAGDLGHYPIRWTLLLPLTALSVAGVFLGGAMGKYIDGARLKRGFGWFVLLVGFFILGQELLK